MLRLLEPRLLSRSLGWAAAITALCMPHLANGLPPARFSIGVAAFFLVNAVSWQILFAWTPPSLHRLTTDDAPGTGRRMLETATTGLVAAILLHLLLDPQLRIAIPDYGPHSWRQFATALPWVSAFQAPFFVAVVFAFAIRLTGRRSAGMVLVVPVWAGIAWLQHRHLPAGSLTLVLGVAVVRATLLAGAYSNAGVAGLVTMAATLYLRFAIALAR